MKFYGRGTGVRRSVYSEKLLKKLSPDGNVAGLFERMQDPDVFGRMDAMVIFCRALNAGYEKNAALMAKKDGKTYEMLELTADDWDNLTEKQLNDAMLEALKAWNEDAQQEVEVEPAGKGKNAAGRSKVKS